ncbi:uncharacterized protein N7500_007447 [Penicillium coprophilum]|uniref:uncharacterized protein n=1 Tax=Penicillium coprophilum TaxID=36646 RepID=UPI00239F2572|nr:uncharacterized protein N7500_007447 [Penicillium coprophilum]KAJ5165617.1 hypothetical protein N7500_007447 [Penicillium coprophilum]
MASKKPPKRQLARTPKWKHSEVSPLTCSLADTEECLAHLNEMSRACHAILENKQSITSGPIDNSFYPLITKPRDLLEMLLHTMIEWNEDGQSVTHCGQLTSTLAGTSVPTDCQPVTRDHLGLWPTFYSNYAVHIEWDGLSTEPWMLRDIKKLSLVEHSTKILLTIGNGHAILTPIHGFIGLHLNCRPLIKSISLASCDELTPTYCETIQPGGDGNVTCESKTELGSLDGPTSSTPKAKRKRESKIECPPVRSTPYDTTIHIRSALDDYDQSALVVCDMIDRL